jgi:hypothetical protein
MNSSTASSNATPAQQLLTFFSQGRRRYVAIGLILLVLMLARGGTSSQRGGALAYSDLLNQSLGNPTVSSFVRAHCSSEMNYLCRRSGIEFTIGETGRVRTVFLYAQGADGFQAYTGQMPFGLRWSDTRADIEARLGTPDYIGGTDSTNVWTSYKSRGILIFYDTFAPDDMSAHMHHISIRQP